MSDAFTPKPEHKFTFGLWTVGNPGRDPFGEPVRPGPDPGRDRPPARRGAAPTASTSTTTTSCPIDATPAERDQIVQDFKKALADTGHRGADGHHEPLRRPGLQGRRLHLATTRGCAPTPSRRRCAPSTSASSSGAKVYVFWGGREGIETDATKSAARGRQALPRGAELPARLRARTRSTTSCFALEAKPNEPRGDIYLPTTGSILGFIETLDHPEMVGVNPEVAHEHMSGLNFMHAVAQAWDAGKLFHIDLNDQAFGRYDQDLRFGSHIVKSCFFLVKFLEDVKYPGMRHFDSHAYRTEDLEGVKDFARGCMRTYLIYKEKAAAGTRTRRSRPSCARSRTCRRPGCRRSAPTPRRRPTRSRATRSTARPSGPAAWATRSSTS